MKKWSCAAVVVAAICSLRAAPSAAAPAPAAADALHGRLLVAGSNTMAPLVSDIARRFETLHPGVSITVQPGGSARGLDDVRQGRADIGMVSRALYEAERDLRGLPIARDGVAIVVHRDNPVATLAQPQVAGIYAGRIDNWKQVGGRDLPIVAYRPDGWRASSELFAGFFGVAPQGMRAQPARGDAVARLRLLAAVPGAILYTSISIAERSARAGAPIRLLPVAGVAATSRNIRNGTFPVSRALTLATRAQPAPLAKAFIEYCASSQITDLVVAHDFVPYLD